MSPETFRVLVAAVPGLAAGAFALYKSSRVAGAHAEAAAWARATETINRLDTELDELRNRTERAERSLRQATWIIDRATQLLQAHGVTVPREFMYRPWETEWDPKYSNPEEGKK